jgi:hypothetical protein
VFVPVVDRDQRPLMPTTPSRARRWIKTKKATPFWKRGVFCVRLNVDRSGQTVQPIAVGLDPGSKKEAYSVKSAAHTFLHLQADAVTWVKEAVETRRQMRRARRYRKTPYRRCRSNRRQGHLRLAPSTRARWGWKLRLCRWLTRLYPITVFVVEDVAAQTRAGQRRWNRSFSMLEVGKLWFYTHLAEIAPLVTRPGHYTAALREALGLTKTRLKVSDRFDAHCVDSWVLANFYTGGHRAPDNTEMLFITPLRFHRRQLHRLQAAPGGVRKPYGGTRSAGFTRGSLVTHLTYGLTYVGGASNGRLSLHRLRDGKRLTHKAKPSECRFRSYNSWRTRLAAR